MTLDPVHMDEVARLAGRIATGLETTEHGELAEEVWEHWLDPLRNNDGSTVLEPLETHRRRRVPIDDLAVIDRPFPSVHAIDSGTINPTTFKNGLVLDLAQAAMAARPSDLDIHRARTLVGTVHLNDPTTDFPEDWVTYDDGFSRQRIVRAPSVDQYAGVVVHALALYLAESTHARTHLDAVSDLLVLDGPIYPKAILNWEHRHPELAETLTAATPQAVIEEYIRLVEDCLERDIPLVGFVKNPSRQVITQALRDGYRSGRHSLHAPWVDDAAFFRQLLERRSDGDILTDELTYTDWFISRGGPDRALSLEGSALDIDRRRPAEDYEVTFFACYEPRTDIIYIVEAPYGVTKDPAIRQQVTIHVLASVAAAAGPPAIIGKADELARINANEKAALSQRLELAFDSRMDRQYDDLRWGDESEN